MKKKQPSGYQNRLKRQARLKSAGVVMPLAVTLDQVSSLTALTSTRLAMMTKWFEKKLPTDDFAVFIKCMAEFRSDAVARIAERQLEADEALARAVEAHEAGQSGMGMPVIEYSPAASIGPVGGEIVNRGTTFSEVSE